LGLDDDLAMVVEEMAAMVVEGMARDCNNKQSNSCRRP